MINIHVRAIIHDQYPCARTHIYVPHRKLYNLRLNPYFDDQGTEKVEGIFLDTSDMGEMYLSSKAFVGMYSLRLLKIYDSRVGRNCKVYLPCGLDFLSDELRYLYWNRYPFSFLPSNFQAENLVELNLACSYVEQLWTGVQNIVSLKEINLNNSKHLATFPDMSQAKNLERANLEYCTSFVKVSSSIRFLEKLTD
ncbi:hypothetical protein MANES_18G115166v8 [Manihot esculenta]|uniref:Uncharacterized protein n=1 Tax=Manihot esculenta TaxID=3983 RepID=A0ACB7FZY0_MANES|nr:hypothetical protein MANES_18G115166v8 [Manihot esculenta]